MKQYFKIKDSEEEVQISTGYELGGYNNWNGQTNGRGYYVYAQPVKRKDNCISFTLFSGFKQLVEPVNRKGEKAKQRTEVFAEQNALDLARKLAERENFELDLEV